MSSLPRWTIWVLVGVAAAYIGMDTGPMHVSAVLGRPTLGVYGGGHRAERFLPAGPRAAAIRMPITCYGCDWHCPFDSRLCLSHIPPQALIDAGDAFLATYLAGTKIDDIRSGLKTFDTSFYLAPGRLNLEQIGDFHVLLNC